MHKTVNPYSRCPIQIGIPSTCYQEEGGLSGCIGGHPPDNRIADQPIKWALHSVHKRRRFETKPQVQLDLVSLNSDHGFRRICWQYLIPPLHLPNFEAWTFRERTRLDRLCRPGVNPWRHAKKSVLSARAFANIEIHNQMAVFYYGRTAAEFRPR
ncbi:uncharacterized protein BCR38DRAFT_94269 [Pseudomassariella vexata]|uniref:Uncharacterized protein n=1 Tax=Pseudomassariella vexata TaxID=1141098 RepID=A0A1Y2EE66_9PEZI|nr:uncharacterized protein BCR38DRAFT_94269 [Pseudomassariella vexata]ORY69860.1 hypothetical protein BCR38DRAFT_94269 [Pseudomassariella vexata]